MQEPSPTGLSSGAPDFDAWIRDAEALLKGRPWTTLRATIDGVAIEPLYLGAEGTDELRFHADAPELGWRIRARVRDVADARAAVALGAHELWTSDPQVVGAVAAELAAGQVTVLLDTTELPPEAVRAAPRRAGVTLLVDAVAAPVSVAMAIAAGSPIRIRVSTLLYVESSPAGLLAQTELGLFIEETLAVLRGLEARGAPLEAVLPLLEAQVTTGRDILVTACKLRALRALFGRLQTALGVTEPVPLRVHAITGVTTTALRDPWNNLLRATFEGTAAVIGGADSVTLGEVDAVPGGFETPPPEGLGRRLALTAQWVLGAEGHLGRVRDPLAGAYAAETLTAQLVTDGWAELQRFEALVEAGETDLRKALPGSADRLKSVATRRTVVVGVNDFAPTADHITGVPAGGAREGAEWERLAARVQALEGRLALVALGPVKEHAARLEFVMRFVQAAGFQVEVVASEGLPRAPVHGVIFCGADTAYVDAVPALAPSWSGALVRAVAGAQREHEGRYRAAGVTDFVVLGQDLLALAGGWADLIAAARPTIPERPSARIGGHS
ncbi:MAG: hypothetical protein IV100_08745 [Myxococcales bacterium]|nr:hypothetical protein [Myxococcales bacterium]